MDVIVGDSPLIRLKQDDLITIHIHTGKHGIHRDFRSVDFVSTMQ